MTASKAYVTPRNFAVIPVVQSWKLMDVAFLVLAYLKEVLVRIDRRSPADRRITLDRAQEWYSQLCERFLSPGRSS